MYVKEITPPEGYTLDTTKYEVPVTYEGQDVAEAVSYTHLMIIIGIDHGYYAIKTRQVSFPSGIIRYDYEPYTCLLYTSCKVFGKVCTPQHPIGACMVSGEGVCSAYYQYS